MKRDDRYAHYRKALEEKKERGFLRSLKTADGRDGRYIHYGGRSLINLSSNDYLGLATDRERVEAFYRDREDCLNNIEAMGPGSSSSRLLTGDFPQYRRLEEEITSLYRPLFPERGENLETLVFNSGYHANTGIIPALAGKGDLVLSDSLNHASIIDGVRLSRADYLVYRHLDYQHLDRLLTERRNRYRNVLIVSESVFSMDGDIARLDLLSEIKRRHRGFLYIDEAHAAGVFGEQGLGVAEQEGIADIDILVATFGKALASLGAYAVLDGILREYLVNRMRSLIFSTALPPVIINWNLRTIGEIGQLKAKRKKLLETAEMFRNDIKSEGLETGGESQIVPVITGSSESAVAASEELIRMGFLAFPIRPPSVPEGSSRLRISLTSHINPEDIREIPAIIRKSLEKRENRGTLCR